MSIKSELTKGVFWIALARYSGTLISLVITAILARHISPAAFGTMALATVILTFIETFTEFGVGAAIIQFKDLTHREINSMFTIVVVIGLIMSFFLYSLSPWLANYYHDSQLQNVCRCLTLVVMFNALNSVPNGMMLRDKRFRVVALRSLCFQIISGVVAVWGALHGWGVYSLIVSPLVTSTGVFIVNFYNYPLHLIIKIDFRSIIKVWKYSSFQFFYSITNYLTRNVDKLLIGKYFPMKELGYYDKSYRLMQIPLNNISNVISPVLHPILSTLQDDKAEIARKNVRLVQVLSWVSFPLGIILFFCAPEIIELVFGSNWKPSIPIFKILSFSVPLQVIMSTSSTIFLSAGRSDQMFFVGILNTVITIISFFIAVNLFGSIDSIAWALNISFLLSFFLTYVVMYKKTFREGILTFFCSFRKQGVNSLVVIVVTWMLSRSIDGFGLFTSLFIKTLFILLVTGIMATLLGQYNMLSYIYKYLRNFNFHKR